MTVPAARTVARPEFRDALEPYERALISGQSLVAVASDGSEQRWDTTRWLAGLDRADHTVLGRCVGPTLDVGCGPGRFVQACALAGQIALGVDVSSIAVELTARRGAAVLHRDVFAPVPGEGRWLTVLVMDGNIGIGGDPASLLARLAQLMSADGQLLVEVDPDDRADHRLELRLVHAGRPAAAGPTLAWARTGRDALGHYAGVAGLRTNGSWRCDGRAFVQLVGSGTGVR